MFSYLEVILREGRHPQSFGNRDGSLALFLCAGEQPKKRALSGPVGADQPVAPPRVELEVDPVEQDLAAVGLGKIGDRNHGGRE